MTNRTKNKSAMADSKRRNGNHGAEVSATLNNTNLNDNCLAKKTSANNKNKKKNKNKNKTAIKTSFDKQNLAINNNSNIALLPQSEFFQMGKRGIRFGYFNEFIQFINYWWFRYLMVTELYMVEKWERVVIHIILYFMFSILWVFNYSILLSITGSILGTTPIPNIWHRLSPENSN